MVQGLGQRRGACSEFSPGIPFMCRKVEMRLACTATRLPPTPAGAHRGLDCEVLGKSRQEAILLLSFIWSGSVPVLGLGISGYHPHSWSPRKQRDSEKEKQGSLLGSSMNVWQCHRSGGSVRGLERTQEEL